MTIDTPSLVKEAETVSVPRGRSHPDHAQDAQLCPHCGQELTEKSTYTDSKGWVFCRSCFRKGKGLIRITDKPTQKKATARFAFESWLPYSRSEFTLSDDENTDTETPIPTFPVGVFTKASIIGGRQHGHTSFRATSPAHRDFKDTTAYNLALSDNRRLSTPPAPPTAEEPPTTGTSVPLPSILLPLAGAARGAIVGAPSGEALSGAAGGLMTGSGSALGALLASHYTKGDIGSQILGGVGGGALGYLLSQGVRSLARDDDDEENTHRLDHRYR